MPTNDKIWKLYLAINNILQYLDIPCDLMTIKFFLLLLGIFIGHTPTTAESSAAFEQWLIPLRQQALEAGIATTTLEVALTDLDYIPRVVELQNRQPESRLTLTQYLERVVSTKRLARGRNLLNEHSLLLKQVSARYNVQPRFIVALWGHESDYGQNMGSTPTIAGLASLAFKGRRKDFFRSELLAALHILDDGHIAPQHMLGSWAGALGQCQFMPSNFNRLAVDFDNDGRRDIWHTPPDVFASIANFLAQHGWSDDQTWGRQVIIPDNLHAALIGYDVKIKLKIWQALGVRRADGRDLPQNNLWSTLLQPDGPNAPAYLIYDNFRTLLRWNRSTYFAISIGQLADRY